MSNTEDTEEDVLHPEELGFEDNDDVTEIDENKYVINTQPEGKDPLVDIQNEGPTPPSSLEAVADEQGIEAVVKIDGEISHHTFSSNDITSVFDQFLLWYARQADEDLEPEETVYLLLDNSSLDIEIERPD